MKIIEKMLYHPLETFVAISFGTISWLLILAEIDYWKAIGG